MTKTLVLSTVVALALTTSLSADFSFGDMFKDMKDGEHTVTSVSHDAKDTAVKASDDLKTSEIATVNSGSDTATGISKDVKDSSNTASNNANDSTKSVSNNINSDDYQDYLKLKAKYDKGQP